MVNIELSTQEPDEFNVIKGIKYSLHKLYIFFINTFGNLAFTVLIEYGISLFFNEIFILLYESITF